MPMGLLFTKLFLIPKIKVNLEKPSLFALVLLYQV
jgi:hypothetical protein